MLDFQKKKKVRQILYSPWVSGIVVIIALYAVYSTWSVYQKYVQSKSQLTKSESQVLALDRQNTTLDGQISALQTPQGVEDEIRSKYGMAKTGEALAVISESNTSAGTATTTQTWWQKFIGFFGF